MNRLRANSFTLLPAVLVMVCGAVIHFTGKERNTGTERLIHRGLEIKLQSTEALYPSDLLP